MQLRHTRSAVAVQPDTSYCHAAHTVQLTQQLPNPTKLPFTGGEGAYCSPPMHVGHDEHTTSAVCVHADAEYSPAAHVEHSASTASADKLHAATTYCPAPGAEQLRHTRFCCPIQSDTWYCPAPHAARQAMQQSDAVAELAFDAALYSPAPHFGQNAHTVSAEPLHADCTYCPPLHSLHARHTASCDPPHSVEAKSPGGQTEQLRHTRSDVGVQLTASYCVSRHGLLSEHWMFVSFFGLILLLPFDFEHFVSFGILYDFVQLRDVKSHALQISVLLVSERGI